uniref:KIB1-4 beta-propeller domain-containing protein n=1 Tax=Aegilops tauschii TaxID=37682 RepID=M8B0R4_AEGTA
MAPDEVPTPLATPLLPRAKRVKEDPAMAAEDWSKWSTLLPELLRLIAESFLGTNDVDCYVDFRAVCPSWRAATDDPKDNTSDRGGGSFSTSEYQLGATTNSGYVVLADKSPPHVASVHNPLTGVVVRFAVPVPPDVGVAHVVVSGGGSLRTLVLIGNSSGTLYMAGPDSQDLLLKAAVGGGVYAYLNPYVDGVLTVIYNFLWTYHFDPLKFFSGHANYDRGFLVGLAGHMLLVFKPRGIHYPCVLRFDNVTRQLVLVQKIGKYAIFVGHQRCLAVDSNKFPGVEENCVYYTQHLGSSTFIYKCNIADKKVERISESDDFVRRDMQFVLVAERPFTIIHILSSYTINIPDSQLALQQMP